MCSTRFLRSLTSSFAARRSQTLEQADLSGKSMPANFVVVPRRMGEIELANERSAGAIKWLQRAARAAPTDVETQVLLSDAHWVGEDEEEAVNVLREALELVNEKKRPKKHKSLSIKVCTPARPRGVAATPPTPPAPTRAPSPLHVPARAPTLGCASACA